MTKREQSPGAAPRRLRVRVTVIKEQVYDYDGRPPIRGPEDAARFLRPIFDGDPEGQETFRLVALTTKNEVKAVHLIGLGTINASVVHPREIFKAAIDERAVSIMLAHNHPTGDPTPSREDLEFTERIRKAGELMGIKLLDHIILGNGRGWSVTAEDQFTMPKPHAASAPKLERQGGE